jgi:hypothetical protein
MASVLDFVDALLAKLNAPVNPTNEQVLAAFAQSEGTGLQYNNPFDTTINEFGAPGINSVNVRNFATFDQGVQATADTFQGGNYPTLVQDLRQSAPASAYLSGAAASELQLWQGGSTIAERVIGSGTGISWAQGQTSNEAATLAAAPSGPDPGLQGLGVPINPDGSLQMPGISDSIAGAVGAVITPIAKAFGAAIGIGIGAGVEGVSSAASGFVGNAVKPFFEVNAIPLVVGALVFILVAGAGGGGSGNKTTIVLPAQKGSSSAGDGAGEGEGSEAAEAAAA